MKLPLRNVLRNAEIILKERNIPNAHDEAFYLLNKYIPCTRGDILLGVTREIDPALIDAYMKDISKRTEGIPLQYLLGKWEFYGLEFLTLPGVLIPRSDTELLIDFALPILKENPTARILDLCCGSGCIGLTLGKLLPQSDITLFDISRKAIDAATRNTALHGLEARTHIVQGDMLEPGDAYFPPGMFDMILCNPPYIKTEDLPTLSDEVKNEPITALDGGVDGLTFYRALADSWRKVVKPGGYIIAEAGYDTTRPAAALFTDLENVKIHKDLGGHERMITAQIKKEALQ